VRTKLRIRRRALRTAHSRGSRWIERGGLNHPPTQRERALVLHNLADLELDQPLRSRPLAKAGGVPQDRGSPGELEGPARLEINEQQSRAGIERQIAKGLEHVVAGVVREGQTSLAEDTNEAGIAAAVGAVDPGRGVH